MSDINIGLGNYNTSIRKEADSDYVSFWNKQAKKLHWFSPWTRTLDWNPPFARWFVGGKINASYNALDIHQSTKSQKPAILWEGENKESRVLTYEELFINVQKFANVLKSLGVKQGSTVTIYLPMVPELLVAMLACARVGAIHSIVFSGFSAASLKDRIADSHSSLVITADGGYRRGKIVKLKDTIDEAISDLDFVEHVIVLERAKIKVNMNKNDHFWHELLECASPVCDAIPLDSTHPLYILYTSGTTGRPKGVLHGTGGYLTHLYSTFKWAFDICDSDVFFCTADIGWVTGHSYVVYAPLLHGATIVMYEGAPDYPDHLRTWEILQKYNVTIFYTTPTALRMLAKFGDHTLDSFELSLRLLGTVGEPINPEIWKWYFEVVGKRKCPIIDTWWQTETGGMMISALPGIETIPLKPGSGTRPIPGLDISIVDEDGNKVAPNTKGHLIVKNPWPGMLLSLWNDDKRYKDVYWSKYENCFYTGDYALKDDDGYLWLLGRADDVLKVAGHRIGTAELESCLVSHDAVAESAVCGVSDEIKGQVIVAFVVLKDGITTSDTIQQELVSKVRDEIGAIATPKKVCIVPKLPKTRSGKIMRRLLKSIASGKDVGDTSTLEDGDTVAKIQSLFDSLK